MSQRIRPEAAAAREHARRRSGEFGVQPHTPPPAGLDAWEDTPHVHDFLTGLHRAGGALDWDPERGEYALRGPDGRVERVAHPYGGGGTDDDLDTVVSMFAIGGQTFEDWEEHGGGAGADDYAAFLADRAPSQALRRLFGDEQAARIAGVDSWVGAAEGGDVSACPDDDDWIGVHPAFSPPDPDDPQDYRNWDGLHLADLEPLASEPDEHTPAAVSELVDAGVEVRAERIGTWETGGNTYGVRITRPDDPEGDGVQVVFNGSRFDALAGRQPSCEDVLEALLSDASSYSEVDGTSEFMDAFGYTDELAAGRGWHGCKHIHERLGSLLGETWTGAVRRHAEGE